MQPLSEDPECRFRKQLRCRTAAVKVSWRRASLRPTAKGLLMCCCGRFTVKATWAEIVALYRLALDRPPHNLQPRYNLCPTDPIDVVTDLSSD